MAAFERADVEDLARMLAEEVVLEMPPMWNWYLGPAAYAGSWTGCSTCGVATGGRADLGQQAAGHGGL